MNARYPFHVLSALRLSMGAAVYDHMQGACVYEWRFDYA